MKSRGIPLASMEKIIKKVGADRISEGAKEELRKIIEEKIGEISQIAIKLANHAGRKTIKTEDIKLAHKK